MMSTISIVEVLKRRIANEHPDPETRLLRDLSELPLQQQQSAAVQFDAMCRVATEERLKREVARARDQITASADTFIQRIDADAARWAEEKHLKYLTAAMRKAWDVMPINAQARKQAYFEIAVGGAVLLLLAWLAILGGQKIGFLPSPTLTVDENRRLAWARDIETAGQKPMVDWAVKELTSGSMLLEVQASVAALKEGRSLTVENRMLRTCSGPKMRVDPSPNGPVCWFRYPLQN